MIEEFLGKKKYFYMDNTVCGIVIIHHCGQYIEDYDQCLYDDHMYKDNISSDRQSGSRKVKCQDYR